MSPSIVVRANGMLMHCLICGYDEFSEKRPPLRNLLHAITPHEPNQRGPVSYVCRHCGHVHKFEAAPATALTLKAAS